MFESALAFFLFGVLFHFFFAAVVIGKLVEMREVDFAGEDRVVVCHVC